MKKNKLSPKTEVHYSIKNRKKFKREMLLITLAVIVILIGCAVCFAFGTVTWDPEKGFEPGPSVKYWWQALLIAIGAVISVGSLVGYFFICYYRFKGFYDTQAVYWKTPEYKKAKAKALDLDLYKLKKKDLKWYKKLGYINGDQMRHALEEQATWIRQSKQDKKKINYATPKA